MIQVLCIELMTHRILIADDNTFHSRLIQHVLKYTNRDLEFLFAYDGQEAVNMAIEYVPDMIFMDVYMPDANGVQATRMLREHVTTRLIPIVVVTADPRNENVMDCYSAGCNGFMSKPFSHTQLVKLYRQHTNTVTVS